MKKSPAIIILFCLMLPFVNLAFTHNHINPGIPQQTRICTWQLIKETPTTSIASTAPDASASLDGSTVYVDWQGLHTTHNWTAPGNTLIPGEEIYFEVSTSWSLDSDSSLSSSGGLNTYLNFNWTGTLNARRQSINFNSEPSGYVSNAYIWTVPVGTEGSTMEIIGHADAAVAGGQVRYKFQYVCVDPTPAPTETPQSTPTMENTPTETITPITCPTLTENEKLDKILELYYARIPKGIASSGERNNILDFLGYPGYAEFACGGYQSKVLNFLTSLKFSEDPCERVLLEKWDYGPIQAWWGGHQAVVLYPWATSWMDTGLVLDPWIEQTPKVYAVADWAVHFSAAAMAGPAGTLAEEIVEGSFIGIGPSEVYRSEAAYPIFDGAYVPPGMQGLTREEIEFVQALPDEKRAVFDKWSRPNKKYWLSLQMAGHNTVHKVVADCPLNVYLLGQDGSRSGIASGQVLTELVDVSFISLPLRDGTRYTEMMYPANAGYTLVFEGTGNSQVYVLIGETLSLEQQTSPLQQYILQVEESKNYQVGTDQLGYPLVSGAETIQPITLPPGSEPEWLGNLPGLSLISATQTEKPSFTWHPDRRLLLWGGSLAALTGAVLFAAALIFGILSTNKGKRTQKYRAPVHKKPRSNSLRWLLIIVVFVSACLLMLCGAAGLYTSMLNNTDLPVVSSLEQTMTAIAAEKTAFAQQQAASPYPFATDNVQEPVQMDPGSQ